MTRFCRASTDEPNHDSGGDITKEIQDLIEKKEQV